MFSFIERQVLSVLVKVIGSTVYSECPTQCTVYVGMSHLFLL